MLIADAQVHIWAASTPERPWPARHAPHREPLDKRELLAEMAKAGVDRVVIVPVVYAFWGFGMWVIAGLVRRVLRWQ